MLDFENVTKRFGTTTAVDGVTLSIPQGQMVPGVIGPIRCWKIHVVAHDQPTE